MDSFIYVLFGIFVFCIAGLVLDVLITALRNHFASNAKPPHVMTQPFLLDKPFDQAQAKEGIAREI